MGTYKLSQFYLSSLLFQAVANELTLELLKGNGPVPLSKTVDSLLRGVLGSFLTLSQEWFNCDIYSYSHVVVMHIPDDTIYYQNYSR